MILRPENFSTSVIALQDEFTAGWHVDPAQAPANDDALMTLVLQQHHFNFDLWHEEDKAREPGVEDLAIAQVKRNIDGLNQQRNDAITQIDECLVHTLFNDVIDNPDLPWNSETVGSIVDRLSIASLKVFHMHEQANRSDTSPEHRQECRQKVLRLKEQQKDLAQAMQLFVDDVVNGLKQNKLYRQYKMYNDPNLNPLIYKTQSS